LLLLVLVVGIGLAFLRSYASLSLLEASETLTKQRQSLEAIERELSWDRVEVQRLTTLARIEPRARKFGLVRPEPQAVILLTTRESLPPPGARPLGGLGSGALGRWFERAAKAATIAQAAAAGSEPVTSGDGSPGMSSRIGAAANPAAGWDRLDAGEQGRRERGCEACRDLAALRSKGH
jgi:hypothetical protein